MPSPGLAAQLACIIEVTAPKPGNVHPGRPFADTSYVDFILSAAAIAPVLDRAPATGSVGQTILDAVQATREVTGRNTNLGIILLLAPLARVDPDKLRHPSEVIAARAIRRVVDATTLRDAELAYEAIRLAAPGGLGRAPEGDVEGAPTGTLLEMMALAAERDLVARQYTNEYSDVRGGLNVLEAHLERGWPLDEAVVRVFLFLILHLGDTLIERKLGKDASREASRRAREVFNAEPGPDADAKLASFDAWLRADSNRRNPGACADLVAAILYTGIVSGRIPFPLRLESSLHANV